LIGIHAVRVLGISFIVLYSAGRFAGAFRPRRRLGDVFIGLLAPAGCLGPPPGARRRNNARPSVERARSARLTTAVGLGVTSAPESPIRIFFAEPAIGSWAIFPGFSFPGSSFPT